MQNSEIIYEVRKLLDRYSIYEEDEYGVARFKDFQEEEFLDALIELFIKISKK